METVIETQELSVGYGDKTVLSDVSLALPGHSLALIIGANGSGKSTLLRTLAGAASPLSGHISLGGKELNRYSRKELAKTLAVVLTDRQGGGALTVEEYVSIGRHPYTGLFGRLSEKDRQTVGAAISDVGLSDKGGRMLGTLSDGERQKAMIARALAQQTPVIILDEPTAFLDVAGRLDIMQLLRHLADSGRTILLSSHDISPSVAVADILLAINPLTHSVSCGDKADIIASGVLNDCFPDASIHFDAAAGDFRENFILARGRRR